MKICWKLRLDPRLGAYRRVLVNALFTRILVPFGAQQLFNESQNDLRHLEQHPDRVFAAEVALLGEVFQVPALAGFTEEVTRSASVAHRSPANLRSLKHHFRTLYRKFSSPLAMAYTIENWEEGLASRDEVVAYKMSHLTKEEESASKLWTILDEQDDKMEVYSSEVNDQKSGVEAWQAELSKRKAKLLRQEIRLLKWKGFRLLDQLRGVLKQMDGAHVAPAEQIFHDEFRMPMAEQLSEQQARRNEAMSIQVDENRPRQLTG